MLPEAYLNNTMTTFDKNLNIPLKLSERLTACNNLPSLPSIVVKIMDASQDPDIGIAEIGRASCRERV